MHPQQDIIDGLEKLVAWIKSHPEGVSGLASAFERIYVFPKDMAVMARQLGTATKDQDDEFFILTKRFSRAVSLQCVRHREFVCDRIQVGEKVIPAQPAMEIPAQVIPATPERIVPVYEWQCPPSLLAAHLGDEYAGQDESA